MDHATLLVSGVAPESGLDIAHVAGILMVRPLFRGSKSLVVIAMVAEIAALKVVRSLSFCSANSSRSTNKCS